MSRVASNHTTTRYNNGVGQSTKSVVNRSSTNGSAINNTADNGGRGVSVRSAAPVATQKETVHTCPLCNSEYKDPRVLPCTHTYCLNCIRNKLINNSRVTCPKCHYQAHPFEEAQLLDLPPNLILSQEWRIGARPTPSMPVPKKSITYSSVTSASTLPSTQMPQQQQQQDKFKSSTTEHNEQEIPMNGIASIVSAFNQSSGIGDRGVNQLSSRSSSVSSTQPLVSNLIKVYSESTIPRLQRNDSVVSTDKHNQSTKTFEEGTNRNEQQRISSASSIIRQQSEAHEEACQEITWDTLVHGTTPVAPPFLEQLQTAIENHHHPTKAPERPISALSSDRNSNIDNLRGMVAAIHQHSPEKTSSFRQVPIIDSQLNSRSSTTSQSHNDPNEDVNLNQVLNIIIPQEQDQYSRQASNTDSVRSGTSDSTSKRSPIQSIINNNQQRLNIIPIHQQQDEKILYRTSSVTSSSRHSSERFPPPPSQHLETIDSASNGIIKRRSASSMSNRSSVNVDVHEQIHTDEIKFISADRFNPDIDIPVLVHKSNSTQIGNDTSRSANRLPSTSAERDTHYSRQQYNYLSPISSPSVTTALTSRVELLLSDQKRLEREIEEQIKRLKYDFDDIRTQIDRKQSSIHTEVKTIATRLDDDITEHYHRKQKIYADLAADTTTVGTELERLKSSPTVTTTTIPTTVNNNKQQLWSNLEQIESNIRTIRQAVDQLKETHSALSFAEGHRTLAADTIGQINYNQLESNRRYTSSPIPSPPAIASTSSNQIEQTTANLTPYKYLKIDHLSPLEPEAITMTEDNKKILLGICNKLFILNEYGDTLKTILLSPSIRGIAVSKKSSIHNIAYVSHDETVSIIDIDAGQTLDCVKETDSNGESGTFLPLGIDTDNIRGDVYVCDYRNSCVIKFDDKLEFITQWRIYNHSDQYNEARPKLISVYGQRLYMIVEHSCKPYYNQGIAYTFSLHICDINSGNIIKIIDADLLSTQRLRWPCSVQAINNEKCYILDTMTSGKYFNGQWQKHWSRVLEIGQDETNVVTELFQLDSEAATMSMTKQTMIIAANSEILFVNLAFLQQQNGHEQTHQN